MPYKFYSEGGENKFTVKEEKLPFACPICARQTDYPLAELVEGAIIICSFCKLKITLHGHMLEEVQREIKKLKCSPVSKGN